VGDDEIQAGMTVPPVPDAETVEADQPLDPGDPREQHDLDQGRVGGQQAGDPAHAREAVADRVDVRDSATVEPKPDERGGVAGEDEPGNRADSGPSGTNG